MKTNYILSILSLALFLSLALVSASVSFTSAPTTITLTESTLSQSFNVTTNELVNFAFNNTNPSTLFSVALSPITSTNLTTITVSATSLPLGTNTYKFTINATNVTNSNDSITQSISVVLQNSSSPFCSGVSNPGRLVIDDIELNVLEGFGDEDDNYLYPLDKFEINFNVANDGNFDIKDIEISACIRDLDSSNPTKCIFDEEDMEISTDNFDLDSDDDQDITLTLTADPDNLKAGDTNYVIFLGAQGKVNDRDSSFNKNSTCTSDSLTDLEIRTDENFLIVSDIVTPDYAKCGDLIDLSAQLWNVGDEDLDKEDVYVLVYNQELGLRQTISLSSDLESMDKQTLNVNFKLPANAVAKTYGIEFSVYDDDFLGSNDIYQNSEDDEARYTALLTLGNCAPTEVKSALITAEFSAETPKAVIGNQVIIEATIKNTGNVAANYTVDVSQNGEWSTFTLDPKVVSLNAGESKKVSIYLDINNNAVEGDKEFLITATSASYSIAQKVQVALEKGITTDRIINNIKTNWVIYAIVLVNLILIIAIILVVRSLVRK
jgi:uncharacterized membrane protein